MAAPRDGRGVVFTDGANVMRIRGSVAGSVLRIVIERQQYESPTLEGRECAKVALVQSQDAERLIARGKDDHREIREARTQVGISVVEFRDYFEVLWFKAGNLKSASCQVLNEFSVATRTAESLQEEVDFRRYQRRENTGLSLTYEDALRRKSMRVLRFNLSDDWAGVNQKPHG